MRKTFYIATLISLSKLLFGQTVETYFASTGKGHCNVKISKDNSYEQVVTNCTYAFKSTGTYNINSDTLILSASKIFHLSASTGKSILVTDTTAGSFIMYKRFKKYLIRKDTLIQLYPTINTFNRKWTLTKQK